MYIYSYLYFMPKNLKRYYQAWELHQNGKTLKEIGETMGFSKERARTMIAYVDFRTTARLRKSSGTSKNHTKGLL